MNVSFIIPAYNERTLLPNCIASIRRTATTSRLVKNYEIVVVDDHSTDGTGLIAARDGCRLVRPPEDAPRGLTRARQAGMEAAKYDVHAYIDADVELTAGWCEHLSLLRNPAVAIISGPHWFHDCPRYVRVLSWMFFQVQRVAHVLISPSVQGGNFATTRTSLLAAGGHSVSVDFYGEDTDLAVRMSRVGRVLVVPEMWVIASGRRLNEEGFVRTGLKYVANYLSVAVLGRPVTLHHEDVRPSD